MMPSMPDGPYVEYDPRWPGVKEIKFGDEWRAKFIADDSLPEGVPALYGYALVLMDERGYVTRPRGTEGSWLTVEGPVGDGETPEAWAKRAVKEQTGATADKLFVSGYLECKATSYNPSYEAGTVAVRPFYIVVAKSVGDVPDDSGYERRRMPLNEYTTTLRRQYAAFDEHITAAIDRYVVMSRKGEL